MKKFKQTWWDKDIKTQFNEFKSWVGPSSQPSKKWARNYIKGKDWVLAHPKVKGDSICSY